MKVGQNPVMAQWQGRTMVCEIGNRYSPSLLYVVDGSNEMSNKQPQEAEKNNKSFGVNKSGSIVKKKSPREPKCARCKNHKIIVKVKDHKDDCPKRTCLCDKCLITAERQREMKEQTRFRRKMKKEERLKKVHLQEPCSNDGNGNGGGSDDAEGSTTSSSGIIISTSSSRETPPLTVVPPAPDTPPLGLNLSMSAIASESEKHNSTKSEDIEDSCPRMKLDEKLLKSCSRMVVQLGYSVEELSLVYVILKYSKDVNLAMKRIIEGEQKIKVTTLYKKVKAAMAPNNHARSVENIVQASCVRPSDLELFTAATSDHFAEIGLKQDENLINSSFRIIRRLGYSTDALSLIYVILKYSKKDMNSVIKRLMEVDKKVKESTLYKILKAGIAPIHAESVANIVQAPCVTSPDLELFSSPASAHFPTTKGLNPESPPKRPSSDPGIVTPPTTTGLSLFSYSPVMNAKVPTSPVNSLQKSFSYPGVASLPSTACPELFPYPLGSYAMAAKVPPSPSSPRERPSSYPGIASPPTAAGFIFPGWEQTIASYALRTPMMAGAVGLNPVNNSLEDASLSYSVNKQQQQQQQQISSGAVGAGTGGGKASPSLGLPPPWHCSRAGIAPSPSLTTGAAGALRFHPYFVGTSPAVAGGGGAGGKVSSSSSPVSPASPRPCSYPGMASSSPPASADSLGFVPYAHGTSTSVKVARLS